MNTRNDIPLQELCVIDNRHAHAPRIGSISFPVPPQSDSIFKIIERLLMRYYRDKVREKRTQQYMACIYPTPQRKRQIIIKSKSTLSTKETSINRKKIRKTQNAHAHPNQRSSISPPKLSLLNEGSHRLLAIPTNILQNCKQLVHGL